MVSVLYAWHDFDQAESGSSEVEASSLAGIDSSFDFSFVRLWDSGLPDTGCDPRSIEKSALI